jgi:hypothetical protein
MDGKANTAIHKQTGLEEGPNPVFNFGCSGSAEKLIQRTDWLEHKLQSKLNQSFRCSDAALNG